MSIITVTEKEQQLTHMLRITSEALDVCTAERDALEWDNEQLRRCAEVQEVDRYAALNRKYVKERDTYQVEADKLAMECKGLRDAWSAEPVAWATRRSDGGLQLFFLKESAERESFCQMHKTPVIELYTKSKS